MEIKVGVNAIYIYFDENKKAKKYRAFVNEKLTHSVNKKELTLGNTYLLSEVNSYIFSYFVEPIINSFKSILKSYTINTEYISLNSINPFTKESIEEIKMLIQNLEINLNMIEEAVINKRQPIIKTKKIILENEEEILFETREVFLTKTNYFRREKGKEEYKSTLKVDKFTKFFPRLKNINYYTKNKIIFNDVEPIFEINENDLFQGKINLITLNKIKKHYSVKDLTTLFDNLKEIK